MFCPSCGAKAVDGDRFCQACGKQLPEIVTAATGDEVAPTRSPFEVPGGGFEPYPTSPPTIGTAGYYGKSVSTSTQWQDNSVQSGAQLSAFGAPLAGWWQRVGSVILDALVVGVPLGIVDAILTSRFGKLHEIANPTRTVRTMQGGAHVATVVGLIVVVGLYFAILNGTGTGQTIGNRAPGIGVRDAESGEVIGFKRGILRWFIRFVLYAALLLPGLLNDLYPLWDRRNQTIADKAARSVVIRLK